MPDQGLLLLEVLEGVLTYVQLLLVPKRLWVWGVIPGINIIPPQLNNLQTIEQVLIVAGQPD